MFQVQKNIRVSTLLTPCLIRPCSGGTSENVQTVFILVCVNSRSSDLCTSPQSRQRMLETGEAATSPAAPPTLQEATQLSAPQPGKTQSAGLHRPLKVLEDSSRSSSDSDSKYGGSICPSED